jgi:hypothetical protein
MPTYECIVTLEHDCIDGCPKCNSSGEGMTPDSRGCTMCRGRGTIRHEAIQEDYVVEVDEVGKILGAVTCYRCGLDMTTEAQEEING